MHDPDAQTCLQRIAEGDEGALAAFYRAYEKRLFRFIQTKLNDPFEAGDILNEVFLEVWRKAGTFEGRSSVSTWLFGIAYHKTMDRLRKKKPFLMDEANAPEIADETPGAEACLLAAEKNEHVRFCLDKLKAMHRAVMELAFFEDMGYAEIAVIVACPENTVKTRMFHAKQAMKQCLSRQWGGRHA